MSGQIDKSHMPCAHLEPDVPVLATLLLLGAFYM